MKKKGRLVTVRGSTCKQESGQASVRQYLRLGGCEELYHALVRQAGRDELGPRHPAVLVPVHLAEDVGGPLPGRLGPHQLSVTSQLQLE